MGVKVSSSLQRFKLTIRFSIRFSLRRKDQALNPRVLVQVVEGVLRSQLQPDQVLSVRVESQSQRKVAVVTSLKYVPSGSLRKAAADKIVTAIKRQDF